MIPFEKFSHYSSSLAYFRYEKDLHLYDPVISNMVSKRYRCAIYSDLEDEEDETDLVYESEAEEELLDPKKMEEDSVSAIEEISNNDFIFGNFHQDSDLETVCVIPTISIKPEIEGCTVKIGEIDCFLGPSFLNPEVKDEQKLQKIGTYESKLFDSKSEIDFQLFKNILLLRLIQFALRTESVFASDPLRHRLCLELGNLPSPAAAPTLLTIVFAKSSGHSFLTFDPGGVSKDTVYAVGNFIAAFHRQLAFGLTYAATRQHRNFIFDRGKPPLVTDRIRSSSHPSSTNLIEKCVDLMFAKLILIFDPGGNFIVSFVRVVSVSFVSFLQMIMSSSSTDSNSAKPEEHPILVFDPGGKCIVYTSLFVSFSASCVFLVRVAVFGMKVPETVATD